MLVLYVSKTTSSLYALCLGVVLGLVGNGSLAPILGIMALVSGLLWRASYYIAIMCGFIVSIGYGIFVGGYNAIVSFAPEALFASLVMYPILRFELIPTPLCLSSCQNGKDSTRALDLEIKNMSLKTHTENICRALIDISEIFTESSKTVKEKNKDSCEKMCICIVKEHCHLCPKREICYTKDTALTKMSINSLSEGVYYLGEAKKQALDEKFIHRCPHVDDIITKINHEAKNELKNEIKNDRLELGAACFDLTAKLISSSALSCENDKEDLNLSAIATRCAVASGLFFDKLGVFGEIILDLPDVFINLVKLSV
jgi:hypothetical protein